LEEKLREQSKVYRESKSSSQPSKPAPITIQSLLVEARAICSLRDALKLPNSIGGAFFTETTNSFIEGPTGKAYLRPITDVRFQRLEEEGKASTVLRYDIPSNSDLIGKPVSSLGGYKRMQILLWALDYDKFTECGFLELTLRVNGSDVLRRSINERFSLAPGQSKWIRIPLDGMRLPQ
jgi:hypothetical protein